MKNSISGLATVALMGKAREILPQVVAE